MDLSVPHRVWPLVVGKSADSLSTVFAISSSPRIYEVTPLPAAVQSAVGLAPGSLLILLASVVIGIAIAESFGWLLDAVAAHFRLPGVGRLVSTATYLVMGAYFAFLAASNVSLAT